MKISGQNKLAGEIIAIRMDEISCQVTLQSGESRIVSVITSDSAKDMDLKLGDRVIALIKASEVMIMK